MSADELKSLIEDAEKWRDWTSGEYRLVCKEKYVELVEAYRELKKLRAKQP